MASIRPSRSLTFLLLALTGLHVAHAAGAKALSAPSNPRALKGYGDLPLSFERNEGQAGPEVKFLARGNGYRLSLTPTEAVLELRGRGCAQERRTAAAVLERHGARLHPCTVPAGPVVRMKLLGSNPAVKMVGTGELPGKSNYFSGSDSSQWHTNINNYRKVEYSNIYPGIDLVYYGRARQMEHDFIVSPGADPKAIRIGITGAQQISLNANGDVVLTTPEGKLELKRPLIYQEADGLRKEIAGHYVRESDGQIGFAIGIYDRSQALVIDPVLIYSTFLDESISDEITGIAADIAGNTYVVADAGGDMIVTKINPDGSAILYVTHIKGDVRPEGIAVDLQGNAYMTGEVDWTTFPLVKPIQSKLLGLSSGFITKLNPSGSIVYSTFLGGESSFGRAIAVDPAGGAYITGYSGPSLPTKHSLYNNIGTYVAKVNPSGTSVDYATYVSGSSGSDVPSSIAVDEAGEAIVTGVAQSPDFPLVHALYPTCIPFNQTNPCEDVFVFKLNSTGSGLLYSTFLGAGFGMGVATNATGDAFVAGKADPTGFPIVNALYPTTSLRFAGFASRLNALGSALVYSTFLGNYTAAIAVDDDSDAYLTGSASAGFPIVDAIQPNFGGSGDAFVTKINGAGSALVYSTYLGGSSDDIGIGIAVDHRGNTYVLGYADSADFPLKNALVSDLGSRGFSAFVTKISELSSNFSITNAVDRPIVGPGGDLNYTIVVSNTGSTTADAVVTDLLGSKSGVRRCQVSGGGTCQFAPNRRTATVQLPGFAEGDTRTITINASTSKTYGDYNLITNTATVSSTSPELESDVALSVSTVRETADLSVVAQLGASASGQLHYVMDLANIGPNNSHAVLLLDPLPAGTSFVSSTTTFGTCSFHPTLGANGSLRCPIGNMPNGGTARVDLVLQLRPGTSGAVTNTATVSTQSIDPNASNNSSVFVVR